MLSTIWFSLLVAIGLYCLSTYIKPLESGRNPRILLVGVLTLADAAFRLRATYSVLFAHLPHPAILFRVARAIVGGMWPTILIAMGFRQGARNMLILAAILFAAAPLALVIVLHRTAPGVTLHTILTSPNFYSLEAWPLGIAIPAIALLSRASKGGSNGTGQYSVENTSESATEA
jgi:hypothetical protein